MLQSVSLNNQFISKMDSVEENIRPELYFLIAKFLMSGPCQRSAKALSEELTENGLLCQRLDWRGNYHPQTFQEMVNKNTHITDDFLVQLCCRLGPLLEKCVPSSVKGVRSLLGAGRQSLLRNGSETVKTTSLSLAASLHDAPLLPPVGKRLCPNLAQSIVSREISGFKHKRLLAQPNTYSKLTMHRRILGHLSAVYCVLFDRTGHCIITGADDSLVKIWSTRDGRLLATLRGHQAEITDIAINCENTLVAAGSCDKIIRVWSLKTTYPIAILQGHTGMITSLADQNFCYVNQKYISILCGLEIMFCPSPLKESRYLMSTGADGTVCFWKWETTNLTFETTPVRFMEKTRPGTQMVCSSFSPGGSFLVAGSTDHIIRLYQMAPGPPEKIAELDVHTDHVDSIQFSHSGEKFLSGSKDGTARIWFFRRSKWENILLDISKTLSCTPTIDDITKSNRPRVTMVSWDLCDHHVVTAINDHTIKVWDSSNGMLVHVLEGHLDELFVLEAHPVDADVFLSAGHDGFVILWDLRTGKKITTFFNSIEGQGHGAVFDCKFSPEGQQFACTDSHGHLCIFGYGSSELFAKVPCEQFFHTDYRPLIRDANHYVLDEQTQTAPHLMPPPFLVDVDGNPHPLHYQRLVPGHGSNVRNAPQPPTPSTPRAEIAPLLAEIEEAENRGRAALQGSPSNQGVAVPPPLQSPGGSRNYGMRQSGDVEGVRQAQGNVPVIEDVAESDIALWRRRTIVPDIKPSAIKFDEERRLYLGRSELTNYMREKKKRPQATAAVRLVNQTIQETLSNNERSQRNQRRTSSRQAARARSRATRVQRVANRVSSRPTYATRAALAMDVDESGDDDVVALTPSDSEEEEEWSGSSSESSEYSDWTEDVGMRSQTQSESRRSRRVRRVLSTSDEEGDLNEPSSSSPQQSNRVKKEKKNKKPVKLKKIPKKPKLEEVQDILNYYQPPDWLTCSKPRLSPYLPQIGDEVYYFRQGHEMYVKEVMKHKLYDINAKKQCYYKLRLKSEELCRIVSLHVSLCNGHPPTLCCLKLAQINPESGSSTGGSFTVKYHDMPDVLDFIILRQYYDRSLSRNWQQGDRFRSVIDESWWAGEIIDRSPYQPEYPESHFQCLEVRWDTGEVERMSPWDLQPVTARDPDLQGSVEDMSGASTSNIALNDEELQALSYEPTEADWLGEGREPMTQRIMSSMEALCQLSMAGPFVYPVDVQAYPDYWSIVPFPNDLSTVIQKLENKFYRRANALIWEIKLLERNARLYNEEDSQIVRNATQLVRVLIAFIRDRECRDILSLCDGVHEEEEEEIEVANVSEESNNEPEEEEKSNERGKRKKSEKRKSNKRLKREKEPVQEEEVEPTEETWVSSARSLLRFLRTREDAEPFLSPVDLVSFPDYTEYVQEPMDFATVSEKLESGGYADPDAFVRDVRLIFSNSRAYNTMQRSRIYSMTIRLSAMFEDRVDSILSEWYASASGGARRTRLRTQRLLQSGATAERPETTSWQVVNSSSSRVSAIDHEITEDSSGYSVVRQASSNGDYLRTTIRLPPSRHNTRSTTSNVSSSTSAARVPPIRIRTVAEVSPRDETSPPERRRLTRQTACETATRSTRNRNTPRNEVLVNGEGSGSHQYSTRRSARLISEESRDAEEDDDEENEDETENSDNEAGEDEEEDEEDDEEDEQESEEESEEESDESEEESPVCTRPSRRTNIRPKIRPTAVPRKSAVRSDRNTKKPRSKGVSSSSNTSRSRGANRRLSSTSSEIQVQRHSSRTRSRPRHLTYAESDSDSDNETANISSRGRLRRPTQRMLDYVE